MYPKDQSRSPLPKTTPMKAEFDIESVKITTTDGREIIIYVQNNQGFYRESVMEIGKRRIDVQEIYITDGKVLKKSAKRKSVA